MSIAAKNRTGSGLVLALLAVYCLPVTAFSDEIQYLPDNVRAIASVNLTAAAKTKTFLEGMKMVKALDGKADKEREEMVSKFLGKIARVTSSVGMPENGPGSEEVQILTAIKPITAAEYQALFYKKSQTFKEIKHGAYTIYSYQTQTSSAGKDSEAQGDAFYVADDKYVVTSRQLPVLKKIIDRNKPATLSPAMQAGLKDAGFGNAVNVVVDIQNKTAKQKEDIQRMFMELAAQADFKANIDKVQSLTIKLNEGRGKFKLSATLTCNDAASAAAVKGVGERTLADVKTKAKEEPKEPLSAELQKILTSARTALNAIQMSGAGAKVTADLEVEPEIAVNAAAGFLTVFFTRPVGANRPPIIENTEKAKGPEKAPNK
jgi:hypothetical protein